MITLAALSVFVVSLSLSHGYHTPYQKVHWEKVIIKYIIAHQYFEYAIRVMNLIQLLRCVTNNNRPSFLYFHGRKTHSLFNSDSFFIINIHSSGCSHLQTKTAQLSINTLKINAFMIPLCHVHEFRLFLLLSRISKFLSWVEMIFLPVTMKSIFQCRREWNEPDDRRN